MIAPFNVIGLNFLHFVIVVAGQISLFHVLTILVIIKKFPSLQDRALTKTYGQHLSNGT